MIKKVFIANRGEVVRRIASTTKKLGILSVCLVQKNSHCKFLEDVVDEIIEVEDESVSLYLNQEKMIEFAKQNNCDAIHPGFGFLSENFSFAKMVSDSGLLWIGPPAEIIKIMADKSEAAKIADSVQVPRAPSADAFRVDNNFSSKDLQKISAIGFPLLIKAAFGGGGKGMRLVWSEDNLLSELERASSEAKNSFGDDLLLAERYIEKSRHIEVQVLADSFSNVRILGERDCSVQRRHQKIIEEAPAFSLPEKTRSFLYAAAEKLAKKVNYISCGTVEFLLDTSKESVQQEFYFLEMNTRLQVKHPVTEELFSTDIVEWQIRVAQGEKLPDSFSPGKVHAIEARIYAEDPSQNFLPSPGDLINFTPLQIPGVRWELGSDHVVQVSEKFDPMLAKVIAKSSTREDACRLMKLALEKTIIAGLTSNREFLLEVFSDEKFVAGAVDSSYLPSSLDGLLAKIKDKKENFAKSDFAKIPLWEFMPKGFKTNLENIYAKPSNYQGCVKLTSLYSFVGNKVSVGELCYKSKKIPYIWWQNSEKTCLYLQLDGYGYNLVEEKQVWVSKSQNSSENKVIKAHVPGRVIKVLVSAGQKIGKQETAFVLESMKMEFALKADHDSIIKNVFIKENDYVESGKVLADLE
jgi:acetyl/propionyl-CoA carboxylase alpha subunit